MKGIVVLIILALSLMLTCCGDGKADVMGGDAVVTDVRESDTADKGNNGGSQQQTVLYREGKRIGMSDEGWYSKDYSDVISYQQLKDSPDIMTLLDKVTAKADSLRSVQMIEWDWYVEDYGQDHLYLSSVDENGNENKILLCSFGAENRWLDDADVQDLVSLLIENGHFANETLYEQYLTYFAKDTSTGK